MKNILPLLVLFLFPLMASAQQERLKVAVFTPLYLDSAFDESGNFRYNEKNYARFINPGLDFYLGAQMAVDSLSRRGAPLEVFVYDSRTGTPLADQLELPEMEDINLIIAQTNGAETRMIADAALRMKVPFISATFPNDAGVNNNPFFVILNSTLETHVQGIYRFAQKYHSLDPIVVFRKHGNQEDQLKNFFMEAGRQTASVPLDIRYVDLPPNFTAGMLRQYLDSNRRNICIAGSLEESFGMNLAQALATLNSIYPVRLIGMPTWENFNLSRLNNIEIVYSTPFHYPRQGGLDKKLAEEYSAKMNARAGDLFFRGYETMLRFGLLLLDSREDIASNLSRKGNTVFTQFDIRPVFREENMVLDYFENKNLYFIRNFGGVKTMLQ